MQYFNNQGTVYGMRIILINIQIALLLLIAFMAVLVGGGLAGLTTAVVGAGPAVGPAATGVVPFLLMLFAAVFIGIVGFMLPVSLTAAATLMAAILAGYRYLRWTRFLGIAANVAGMAYFIALACCTDFLSAGKLALFLPMFGLNILLFALMPRRPNLELTRAAATLAQIIICLLPLGLAVVQVFRDPPSFGAGGYILAAVLVIVYAAPFYCNYRAIPLTSEKPGSALAWWLLASLVLSATALVVVFPMGLPMFLGTVLVFELLEMEWLYPDAAPDGARYWTSRLLGRLPEARSDAPLPPVPPLKLDPPESPAPAEKENDAIEEDQQPRPEPP